MKIIDSSYEIDHFEPQEDIRRITRAARICYKSDPLESFESQCNFVKALRNAKPYPHMSPFEQSSLGVVFTTNLRVSHEIVRHRLASPNQESSRYCCYYKERFGNELYFIRDTAIPQEGKEWIEWLDECNGVERNYRRRVARGYSTDTISNCLTKDVKTELILSTNYREWRHILQLRCDRAAHYQMREIMVPLLLYLKNELECVFGDIPYWDGSKITV